MTSSHTDATGAPSRFVVRHGPDVPERASRGAMKVREVFDPATAGYESSLSFILLNHIPPGGANEIHVHDDIEKVYYFIRGKGEAGCGPWKSEVRAGDFLFFPAAIPHMLLNTGDEELEFVVCQARTLTPPKGLGGQ